MNLDIIMSKKEYTICDISKIVNKETQTIRSWEAKGIIKKPDGKFENSWRKYTKQDLIECLENIINYQWKRTVIKNIDELIFIVNYLKENKENE